MVEKEQCHSINLIVECRHGLNPFCEIINDHNDVVMVIDRGRIIGHEVNFPFVEGTDCDDSM